MEQDPAGQAPAQDGEDIKRNEEEKPTCRVCLDEGDTDALRDHQDYLFAPCSCNTYIHLSCLRTWIANTRNNENKRRCEVCLTAFKYYRPMLARVIGSRYFSHAATVALLGGMWIAGSVAVEAITWVPGLTPFSWRVWTYPWSTFRTS